jgi:Family of unknown function (DUF6328)
MGGEPTDALVDDRSAFELDDELDPDELRQRYYGLLQEVRVLLPGVQILVAFLLTVPFDSAFRQLDRLGRDLYGVSLGCGFVAVVAFIAPTALHRLGHRRARSERLVWSIRLCRIGLAFLGASLTAALAVVTRDVFGDSTAVVAVTACVALIVSLWVVLPRLEGRRRAATT